MNCDCGKPSMYKKLCRDCYENMIRRQARDALDNCKEELNKRCEESENRESARIRNKIHNQRE